MQFQLVPPRYQIQRFSGILFVPIDPLVPIAPLGHAIKLLRPKSRLGRIATSKTKVCILVSGFREPFLSNSFAGSPVPQLRVLKSAAQPKHVLVGYGNDTTQADIHVSA